MAIDDHVFDPAQAAFVTSQRVGYLATLYPDGRPHAVPISPVLDLDRLAFATERDTQKVRNLDWSTAVSVAFDEYHEDWSQLKQVIVHGEAYAVDGGFEWERDRDLLYSKFPQYESEAPIVEGSTMIFEVRIDRVTSWGL